MMVFHSFSYIALELDFSNFIPEETISGVEIECALILGVSLSLYFSSWLAPRSVRLKNFQEHVRCFNKDLVNLRTYRKKCNQIVQEKGIAAWLWYIAPWLGMCWFLVTLGGFWVVWRSPWLLTLGIIGWCFSFLWRVYCLQRWRMAIVCTMDTKFVWRVVLCFLSSYVVLCHGSYLLLLFAKEGGFSEGYQSILMAIVLTLYTAVAIGHSVSAWPAWAHILLGKHLPYRDRSGNSLYFLRDIFKFKYCIDYGSFSSFYLSWSPDLRWQKQIHMRILMIFIPMFIIMFYLYIKIFRY